MRLPVLWLHASLLLGCGGGQVQNSSCTSSSCGEGSACIDGACTRLCVRGEDCPAGLGCAFGFCSSCSLDEACPTAFACDAATGVCATSCTASDGCRAGGFCQDGACVPQLGLGATCAEAGQCLSENCVTTCCPSECSEGCNGSRCLGGLGDACAFGNECASGHCTDSVCCDDACGGTCQRCDAPTSLGTCAPVVLDEDVSCQIDASGAHMCDENGVCVGPHLVADVNKGGGPREFVNLTSGDILFTANDNERGRELWIYDGVSAQLVTDIWPGPGSSSPQDLMLMADGARVLFSATDGVTGREPWVSDGTPQGTSLLADINPIGDAFPSRAVHADLGGDLYFFWAEDPYRGRELWHTDGTPPGDEPIWAPSHTVVHELLPGPDGGNRFAERQLKALGTKLYLSGDQDLKFTSYIEVEDTCSTTLITTTWLTPFGSELWMVSQAPGSPGGPFLWSVDAAGACHGPFGDGTAAWQIPKGAVWNDTIFFCGYDNDLWLTSSTPASSVRVEDGDNVPIPALPDFVEIVTDASNASAPAFILAEGTLWRFDGAVAVQVNATLVGSLVDSAWIVGDHVYFVWHSASVGGELARDALDGGALQTVDLWAGAPGSNPALIGHVGDVAYFAVTTPQGGRDVISWDGADSAPAPRDLASGAVSSYPEGATEVASGELYLGAIADSAPDAYTLMRIEPDNTFAALDILGHGDAGSGSGTRVAASDGRMLFLADDGVHGRELWVTDRSAAGTHLVADTCEGARGQTGFVAVAADADVFYFTVPGCAGTYPCELWRYAGATLDQVPVPADLGASCVIDGVVNGHALLQNQSTGVFDGIDLSNGDVEHLRDDIHNMQYFVVNGTRAAADVDTDLGNELIVTDGTAAGTQVIDLNPSGSSYPSSIVVLDGVFYFMDSEDGDFNHRALWRSEGTDDTTELVAYKWILDTYVGDVYVEGGLLWFGTRADTNLNTPWTLWTSGGTTASTVAFMASPLQLDWYIPLGDQIFAARSLVPWGREPWVLTGDPPETALVDLNAGLASSLTFLTSFADLSRAAVFRNHVFFTAFDGARDQLWVSDATAGGTAIACERGCEAPTGLHVFGERLWMRANTGAGDEPAVLP